MGRLRLLLPALLLALLSFGAAAQGDADGSSEPAEIPPALKSIIDTLHPQHGKFDIDKGLLSLDIPSALGYLPPDQANILIHKVYGFPGKMNNIGAIIPATIPIGSRAAWFTLITAQESGHVSDSEAQNLNPGALLKRLREENQSENDKLKKRGFSSVGIEIAGWAKPPHYDATSHTLIWALEVLPHSHTDLLLNYNIVILGRRGAVTMALIGKIEQLPAFEDAATQIQAAVTFAAPNRYTDFTAGDKAVRYGLGAIVTGETTQSQAQLTATRGIAKEFILSFIVLGGVVLIFWLKSKKRAQM